MKKLLTILLLFFVSLSQAATYYFSESQGDDSRTSTQAQNPNTAWKTITKLNAFFSSLSPGDNVLFKRGDTFYGAIVSSAAGSSGNPITIGAYSTGAAPIITGLTLISTWTNLGGGIYESPVISPESTPKVVLVNNRQYAMGRTPNSNASNAGYLTFESHTSSSITDNTNPFTSAYNGSQLVARTSQYTIDRNTVTTISGNTINFSGSFNGLTNNFGYFLQNSLQTLDQYGEWYYNTSTNKLDVFFGTSGTSDVYVSTKNILLNLSNNYLSVDGLNVYGGNNYGIFSDNFGSSFMNINNCSFSYCGINGVSIYGRNTINIDSCNFSWCNSSGLNTGYADTLTTVTHSNFSNIGTFQGMLAPDVTNQRYGFGIFSDNGITCTNNRFTNIGSSAVYFTNNNNLIQHNYIDTFCTILSDGGGIYTYNYTPSGTPTTWTNRVIRDNVVLHAIGATGGTFDSDPNYNPAEGIYIDDNSMNVDIVNNTVAYCADAGIYIHNSPDLNITGNVFYSNGHTQVLTQHGNPDLDVNGLNFKHNQLFTSGNGYILNLRSDNNDFTSMGTFDSNYYCRPLDTNNIIINNWFGNATTNYHLSNWKTASGKDAHTVQTPVTINSSSDVLFMYNETATNKNNSLGGNTYKSVTGSTYFGSITLAPYTSQILLKTPSDTTHYTYHIQHDTLEATTIPQKINHIGDSTLILFDTSYIAYSIYKTYWNVDGSITVTIPLYDTVPAHDTIFVCKNCASHDTTVTTISNHLVTISANNQNKALGATFTFTHNGTQVAVTGGSLIEGDVITVDNSSSSGASSGATSGAYAINLTAVTIMRGAVDVTSTYDITYLNGTLTVAGAIPITITADNQGKTSGQTFTFLHNGSQVDVTSGALNSGDVITVDNAASSGSGSGAAAGTYPITLSSVTIMNGATNVTSNYAITYVGGTLTVSAAPLVITVKARNQTKQYGSTFTFTHTGAQVQVTSGGLASGDVITVDNAASSGSSSSAAVGSYAISLSSITIMNGATNVTGNYTITYQAGTLTVTTIPLTIKANNQSKTQGNAFTFLHNGTQVSVVSGALLSGNAITVDNAASTGSSATVPTGSYPITLSSATITSGVTNVTANYSITYQGGTLSVSAAATPMIYGMLPNEVAATTAQQLHTTKIYSNNGYRHRIDIESIGNWVVKQVRDSGLISILTVNSDPTAAPILPFPTGTLLTRYLNKFDSLLSAHSNALPDYIFIQNEEDNPNYWSGKVQDYMAWLNGCVTICHNHGVPVGNGGILTNIAYYIRAVWKAEGKTDSVNLITKLGNLPPGVGTAQQAVIDWYNIEIPGLTTNGVDYINLHWYEPTSFIADNSDTTSGMLPLAIKFLASRTGKPVITNEWGTKHPGQAFFNETADQWRDGGVKMMVYYDGTGPVAEAHPEFWSAWILQ